MQTGIPVVLQYRPRNLNNMQMEIPLDGAHKNQDMTVYVEALDTRAKPESGEQGCHGKDTHGH
jgi:hypothetical protein